MLSQREIGLALYAAALAAIALIAPKFPVYWDSWGYLRQAIEGDVGGLGFGRPVFVLTSHGIASAWQQFGGSLWTVDAVLRVFWSLVSSASAPLVWRLALQCGLTPRAALVAGLAVAASPAVAHAGGTMLTDGPAAALLAAALLAGVRARHGSSLSTAALAGALLGLAIGVREQSIVNGVALALLIGTAAPGHRLLTALVAFTVCTVVVALPMAYVLATQPGYPDTVRHWLDGMAHDRAIKTYSWRDLAIYAGWLLSLSPAVVIAAIAALATRRSAVWQSRGVLFAIAIPACAQLLSMAGFLGVAYSPRFLVPGFVTGLAMLGAMTLDRWAGSSRRRTVLVGASIVLPILIATPLAHGSELGRRVAVQRILGRLNTLPPDAVVVTGSPCPAIPLYRELIARTEPWTPRPEWQTVCPGWSWPSDPPLHFDSVRRAGHTLVLDLYEFHWIGAEQRAALGQVQAYRARLGMSLPHGVSVLGDRFR